jgi:hypothetical protein
MIRFEHLSVKEIALQINLSVKDIDTKMPTFGLLYKLVLAPALILLLYQFIFHQQNLIVTISVMGASIKPMNTATVIAGKYVIHLLIQQL